MKKLFLMLMLLVAMGGTSEVRAQSFLKKLGRKVENAAKNAIERNAERATERAVDNAFQKTGEAVNDAVTGNDNNAQSQQAVAETVSVANDIAQSGQQNGKSLEITYAKSDFVPGDEIIFEDPMDNEQLGEWPSMWELYNGNGETMSVGGKKALMITERGTQVGPLMKEPFNYLGDVFTIEFDWFFPSEGASHAYLGFYFHEADNKDADYYLMQFNDGYGPTYNWKTNIGESRGDRKSTLLKDEWNHFAISFNKRAWKVYVNGIRVINVPNVKTPPGWFHFEVCNGSGKNFYLTNLRIAKGAVPLYDRMMTDGKIITYGITFDVGKATIKPESMGEINRIVTLMNENPDLKFSVEGHTDATGNAIGNQTLSEQRSAAIVAKLVELGIAKDRLTAVGKGQNNPIADNSTDEGRAKNRRVEFVKM